MIRRTLLIACPMFVALLGLLVTAEPAAAANPQWSIQVYGQPTNFDPTTDQNMYFVNVTNVGNAPSNNLRATRITDELPDGITADEVNLKTPFGDRPELCSIISSTVQCEYPRGQLLPAIAPGEFIQLKFHAHVASGITGQLTNRVTVSGGGAASASALTNANSVSESDPPFGWQAFQAAANTGGATSFTQAGGHPYSLQLSAYLNNKLDPRVIEEGHEPLYFPIEEPNHIVVDFPSGLIANPEAVPQCPLANFFTGECPADDQIGNIRLTYDSAESGGTNGFITVADVYNLAATQGNAASIGFLALGGLPFLIDAGVRTGGDYAVESVQKATPNVLLTSFSMTLWGVPADPTHNFERGQECFVIAESKCLGGGLRSEAPLRPFLRLPSTCSGQPLAVAVSMDSWNNPGAFVSASSQMPSPDGCNGVPFGPSIQARPTTNLADSPSGLDADVHVPQNEAPEGVSSADLRNAVVKLPSGVRLNPSAANGRKGCSEAEIELHGSDASTCPTASKLGTVEVDTPLLGHPLPGSVYLATPHQNPFGSLLAMYAVVEDPISGVIVKLPGKVGADPQTGQLTTSFEEDPQLPFEDFHLKLFGGAEGALRTPSVCGTYKSTSVLTPWSAPESGPAAEPSDEFQIAGNCAQGESSEPNFPVFHAGTEAPQAGKFSPFAFKLVREDGSQELSKIETTLPPGLSGKLAGVPYCTEAAIALAKSREHDGGGAEELASPSCPGTSEVGKVDVGAGAGPDPYYTSGHAYLAGPYEGAPLSLVTIVPAVAGPFDLGDVVTRIALHVNPQTTQITAISDPLPHIIDGIPLDIRSITLKLDRPQFTLNPTSCNPMSIGGSALSVFSQAASLTQRFQVGGCNALPFKPKLSLRLKGSPKRSKFPALTATLQMKPGEANVAAAQVTLPHSSFLSNAHIDKTCSHPELEAGSCPAASVYGHARAWSPLLEKPLEGNVYLVTGFGYELPALVADLQGQIEVHLVGKVDSGREDGIRNTFEVVPDAPVSKFVLEMAGGKRSLIENSENLCAKHAKRKALAELTGQNGKVWDTEPTVANSCKRKKHHRRHKGHRKHHRSG